MWQSKPREGRAGGMGDECSIAVETVCCLLCYMSTPFHLATAMADRESQYFARVIGETVDPASRRGGSQY